MQDFFLIAQIRNSIALNVLVEVQVTGVGAPRYLLRDCGFPRCKRTIHNNALGHNCSFGLGVDFFDGTGGIDVVDLTKLLVVFDDGQGLGEVSVDPLLDSDLVIV